VTRPFDARLLTQVPATRRPVLALGAIGVAAGVATIALAFALTSLVVAVVESRETLTPGLWLVGLFTLRASLAMANELVGTWAGVRVSTVLRERLIALVTAGTHRIVLDFNDVEFIDSTGLGVLVGVLKRTRARGGSMTLVCSQDGLLRVFKITGLEKVFPIYRTLEDAAEAAAS